MPLSQQEIAEFSEIFKTQFDTELDTETAEQLATTLVDSVKSMCLAISDKQ